MVNTKKVGRAPEEAGLLLLKSGSYRTIFSANADAMSVREFWKVLQFVWDWIFPMEAHAAPSDASKQAKSLISLPAMCAPRTILAHCTYHSFVISGSVVGVRATEVALNCLVVG